MSKDVVRMTREQFNALSKKVFTMPHSVKNVALADFIFEMQWKNAVERVEYHYDFVSKLLHVKAVAFEGDFYLEDKNENRQILVNFKNVKFKTKEAEQWFYDSTMYKESPDGRNNYNYMLYTHFFVIVNNYLMNYGINTPFDVEEKIIKNYGGKKKNSKGGDRNKVKIYRVYTLRRDWEKSPKLKKKFKIHCPAWGVRGHYRHLKNGNVVAIKPYIKGKDKSKYRGKEYELMPHERKRNDKVQKHGNSVSETVGGGCTRSKTSV